jgi:hypothetical protein
MGVFTAWMVAAGLQTYRDVKVQHRVPLPSEYVASGVLFGALALLDGPTQGIAGVVAWGFIIALVLQAGGPSQLVQNGPPGKIGKLASGDVAAPAKGAGNG